jgi:hypothetical protein
VAVLGSSVVLEGIDCGALSAPLPAGARCENLAWTGGTPRQWLLVEPALRRSPPGVIILGLDLFALLHPEPIPADVLAIAGWWSFVPGAERAALRGVLDGEELRALDARRTTQLLRFRSFPLDALNERIRELTRSDLRFEGYATNFTDPWIIRSPARPAALTRHLERMRGLVGPDGRKGLPESERVLALFVERARNATPGTRFLFVLPPVHPALGEVAGPALDATRRSLATLAERLDASFRDDSLALPAESFADAVHPDAAGRAVWSARLGGAAASLLAH